MIARRFRIALVSLAVGSACTAESSPDDEVAFVAANKFAHRLVARDGVIAFLDGTEASSDPSIVGVDVRVVDRDGNVGFVGPSANAIRDLDLLDDAAVTIELTESFADQHVAIRPMTGDPIVISHPAIPLAAAASESGLVWIEVLVVGPVGEDDAYLLELTLVEADELGDVVSRLPIVPPEVLSTPFLGWVPRPFGLEVDDDEVYFGWTTERRNSEVFRIDRISGVATFAWRGRGRYAETDLEPAEVGLALHFLDGELVVVGGIYAYAALAPESGFVAYRETTTPTPEDLRFAAGDGSTLVVAHGNTLEQFDGTLTPLPSEAPDSIWGLALDGTNLLLTTDDGLYLRQF